MRFAPLLFAALGIVLSAGTCNNTSMADLSSMADTKWVLRTLNGAVPTLPEDAVAPWVQLNTADGKMNGFDGCNNIFSGLSVDGNSFKLSDMAGTKKMCMGTQELEQGFTKALSSATSFALKGNELTLMESGKQLATLVAAE